MLLTKLVASFVTKVFQEAEKLQHDQRPQTSVGKTFRAVYSSPTNREEQAQARTELLAHVVRSS